MTVAARELPQAEALVAAIWPADRPAPARKVRCRKCRQANRVSVPRAVLEPERHSCGGCGARLFLALDAPLEGLHSEAYQHSLDRQALFALRALPGIAPLVRLSQRVLRERGLRMLLMSDAVRCDDEQFPELVDLLERARRRLDFPRRPSLFLGESPYMNAMAAGTDDPIVIVRSALLDQMNDEELVAVLGHELGHLQAGHPLYHDVARVVLAGGAMLSGAVRMLSWPIERALRTWMRCSELTADRAGLLASRDLRACMGFFLKLAGGHRPGTLARTEIRLPAFIRQAREIGEMQSESWLDGVLSSWLTVNRSHPYIAWRVMHLIQWIEHGHYLNILAGDYPRRARRLKSGDPPALPAGNP